MSKVLTTAAAIVGLSLGPALAANYHDYHAWSQPTVHDADSYRDYRALTVQANYHPGQAGPLPVHGPSRRKH